ncbi:hypothetical protein AAIA72_14325 [Hahella sp. SMD15-11]|uniref:Tetratricopeptide repeat protein n=1 Tax=Thermohahella caldifontis TaxID=3142973 RepID=A0AB39UW27_9GAMM
MSLLNDVLKDLDQRQSGRQSVPAGLRSAGTKGSYRTRWLPGVVALVCLVGVIAAIWWWGQDEGTAVAPVVGAVPQPSAVPAMQQATPSAEVQAPASGTVHADVVQGGGPSEAPSDMRQASARQMASENKTAPENKTMPAEPKVADSPRQAANRVAAVPVKEKRSVTHEAVPHDEAGGSADTRSQAGQVAEEAVATPSGTAGNLAGGDEDVSRPAPRMTKAAARSPEQEALEILTRAQRVADPAQKRRILAAGLARLPEQVALREALARSWMSEQALDRALAVIQAHPKRPLPSPLLGLQAWIQQQTGQIAESVASYADLIRLEPENPRWWGGLAIGLEQLGQAERARQAWSKVVELPGADTRLLNWARQRLAALQRGAS